MSNWRQAGGVAAAAAREEHSERREDTQAEERERQSDGQPRWLCASAAVSGVDAQCEMMPNVSWGPLRSRHSACWAHRPVRVVFGASREHVDEAQRHRDHPPIRLKVQNVTHDLGRHGPCGAMPALNEGLCLLATMVLQRLDHSGFCCSQPQRSNSTHSNIIRCVHTARAHNNEAERSTHQDLGTGRKSPRCTPCTAHSAQSRCSPAWRWRSAKLAV